MRYKDGIPDYESLTPEEARAELRRLPAADEAAVATWAEHGGDPQAHLDAQLGHRARLNAIAARPQAEPCPSTS